MSKLQEKDSKARQENPLGGDFSEALARGLNIISAFGIESPALTLSQIARRLELPRATVRRALLTLVHLGFAEEDGRLFRLTPKILSLASAYLGASQANMVLKPACERLCAAHGATFSVAALDGDDIVMIAYAAPRRLYGDSGGIGLSLPAYCTAMGRVLVASLPPDKRTAFIDRQTLSPVTEKTITSKTAFKRAILEAQNNGWAYAAEEAEMGFQSLAVLLRDAANAPRFALNAGAHLSVSEEELKKRFLPVLQEAAAELQPLLV
jgi:IclR family pca regulon transcriptional regulator